MNSDKTIRAASLFQNKPLWSDDACCGYLIVALTESGKRNQEIRDILRHLFIAFDEISIEEAKTIFDSF